MITYLTIEILLILITICCIQCGNYGNNVYLLESIPSKDEISDLIKREKTLYLIFKYSTIVCLFTLLIIVIV